jgi:cytochrome c peroxidase
LAIRSNSRLPASIVGVLLLGSGVGGVWTHFRKPAFEWQLPSGFPPPAVFENNPMSAAKVDLGRHLFYDKRLSGNETQACATCHRQELAFTDGKAHAVGSTGQIHRRSSMSLTNVGYVSRLTWANPLLDKLEDQALVPMFGDTPTEMGLKDAKMLTDRLEKEPVYRRLFPQAFPEDAQPITLQNTVRAIAAFERTIISGDSPYDRYTAGATGALSADAVQGMTLFFSERLECFHCHGGFNFSDSVSHAGLKESERAFHNTGLYNVDGKGGFPQSDRGLIELTGRAADMGRFRAPTLRNIAVTAPYMHDGSVATLDDAIDHYSRAGRLIASGPNAGDGAKSPLKESFVGGFVLTDNERRELKAFLESLTDAAFLKDPRFSDPWTQAQAHLDR